MWDFLSNIGGAVKRPFTELPKGKMPDLGAVKPTLAGAASAGPSMAGGIPESMAGMLSRPAQAAEAINPAKMRQGLEYRGQQHPDFVPNIGMPGPARQPWSQEGAARNDWMMQRGERTPGAQGTVLGRDAQTGQEYGGGEWTGKIKRDWHDIVGNALIGYGQKYNESGGNPWAGVGGAIGAGSQAAIDPEGGRNYSFDQLQRPRIREDEARQAQMSQLGMEQEMQRARIDEVRARGQESAANAPLDRQEKLARIKQIEGATRDSGMTREWHQAQIDLMRARQEAAETGQVKFINRINPETGQPEQLAVSPDKTFAVLGGDVKSDIAGKNIKSREKISTDRNTTNMRRTEKAQAGATGRTIISQKGQNERLQTRLGAEGGGQAKVASPAMIQKFASEKGITVEQAKERARKEGFQVQ